MATIKVRVRLWGGLAQAGGFREEVIDVDDGTDAGGLRRILEQRAPGLARFRKVTKIAVNGEFAEDTAPLTEGDEVSLLPPVAGGQQDLVGLRAGPLDPAEALAHVAGPDSGGTGVFIGTVRAENEGHAVDELEYMAFPEMAEPEMRRIVEEARAKWHIHRLAVLHSVGHLVVGDASVLVAVSASHRAEALEACRYVIDEVKSRVPIWKQEFGPDGTRWVNLPEG